MSITWMFVWRQSVHCVLGVLSGQSTSLIRFGTQRVLGKNGNRWLKVSSPKPFEVPFCPGRYWVWVEAKRRISSDVTVVTARECVATHMFNEVKILLLCDEIRFVVTPPIRYFFSIVWTAQMETPTLSAFVTLSLCTPKILWPLQQLDFNPSNLELKR